VREGERERDTCRPHFQQGRIFEQIADLDFALFTDHSFNQQLPKACPIVQEREREGERERRRERE
jgi:hypothetical protein